MFNHPEGKGPPGLPSFSTKEIEMLNPIPRTVAVLCLNSEGSPEFHICTLEITHQQLANGDHYDLAKADAADQGYTQPMIAFDENDEAAAQWPAIKQHFKHAAPAEVMPRCLVMVSGGVADTVSDPGVDVEVFDWDNYRAESPAGRLEMGLPHHFKDLAAPLGIPVQAV